MPRIAALYAALLLMVFLALTARVLARRFKAQVVLGTGGDRGLERAVRVHANWTEYVPVFLAALVAAELCGAPAWALHAAGIRGWRCHPKHVPGKPDIAFTRRKVAVFVDGRFWHGHPEFFTPGKSGAYWDAKIARTQERDRIANERLAAEGWTVLRFWDFEIEDDLARVTGTVISTLRARA